MKSKPFDMKSFSSFTGILLALSSGVITSCSPDSATLPKETRTLHMQQFSQADKEAAKALSLGNIELLSPDQTAYTRTILCDVSVEYLSQRLNASGVLNAERREALDQIMTSYAREIDALGKKAGKSPEEIRTDRAKILEKHPENAILVRTAMGCLQAYI